MPSSSTTTIRKRLRSQPAVPTRHELNYASDYTPRWEGVFRKYATGTMRKNLWRLGRLCTMDDALQEAYLVFLECKRRYCARVDNDAWFMSLYQRALACRITDLANADTRHKEAVLVCDLDPDAPALDAIGETANAGELAVMIKQAPHEVRAVLSLLLGAPVEVLELVSGTWKAHGSTNAYGSKLLCRLLGMPEDSGLLQRVREYFA